ncbi:MAG: helix-turn-helix domain-containing protein [Clostridia bacterium]|nr:helix-turn-helix domain-containing protein [Clostridia bacterium]
MFKKVENQFYIKSLAFATDRQFPEDFTYEGESHDFMEIVYIESGEVEVVENEKVYLLGSGDIIFHAPMEFHRIKSAGNTSPRVFNLSARIQGKMPDNLYSGVFNLDINERTEFFRVFKAANKFLAEENPEPYAGQEAAVGLAALIMRICRNNNMNNNFSSEAGALVYKKIVKTMSEEVYSNLSLTELAEKNHISVSYVKALFYRYASTSPKGYYAKLRVNEAARLLADGTPVAEVAEKMNFSSPNYFSLFFKKHMGMTPFEYKKACDKSTA